MSVPQPTSIALDQPIASAIPVSTVLASIPHPTRPEFYPWGMPNMFNEGVHPVVSEILAPFTQQPIPVSHPGVSFSQAAMTYTTPLIHTTQQDHGPIFYVESIEAFDRVDDLQDKYNEMQQEMKALW